MTTDVQTEKIIFNKILQDCKYYDTVKDEYFETPEIRKAYEISRRFFERYKESPVKKQLKHLVVHNKLEEQLSLEFIDGLFDSNEEYEEQWLQETLEGWVSWRALTTTIFRAFTYMKSQKVSTENVKDVVDKVVGIVRDGTSIELGNDDCLDFSDPSSHRSITMQSFSTGYSFLDLTMGGGWIPGTLNVVMGAQKSGKSVWLLNLAANAVKMGKNVMIITLELLDYQYLQRISANLMGVTTSEYSKKLKDNDPLWLKRNIKKVIDYGDGYNPFGNLMIKAYPTSTASANDIEAFIKKKEATTGIKFDLVVIDYLNIMKNWRNPNSENTYMKVKQISEDVRAMALRNGWAIASATQMNRSNQGSTDISMTDISESIGLASTLDTLYGIIQTELMKSEGEYMLKSLALRNSEESGYRKKFTVNYSTMNIYETADPAITT